MKKVVSFLLVMIAVISISLFFDGFSQAEGMTIYWGGKEYKVPPEAQAYSSISKITKETLQSDLEVCKCGADSVSNLIDHTYDRKALVISWAEGMDTKQLVFGLGQKDNVVAIGDDPLLHQYITQGEHIEKLRGIVVEYVDRR